MPGKRPPLKSAFDIPATEHPVSSPKTARREKPARSSDAFANLIATPQPDLDSPSTIPTIHPLAPETLGPKGTAGINRARNISDRPRTWEKKNQYGKAFSFRGLRPDLDKWIGNVAKKHTRRVGDIAAMACQHSFELVESGQLTIKTRPSPNGLTLFQNGDYNGFVLETPVSKKGRNKPKGKAKEEDWRFKTTTWSRFDQVLKNRIVEFCGENYKRGEFVTFLLLRARDDYEGGQLVFPPGEEIELE
jgi:hypothetical protein